MDVRGTSVCLMAGILAMLPMAAPAETTLTVATVDNGDMVRMQRLAEHFQREHPDIAIEWEVLDENLLRQQVTTDIATGVGRYDVITIGNYEAPIWAERDWLVPLDDLPGNYGIGDLLPSIREGLSHEGVLYGAPFYGESAFTMYRTDLFAKAGLDMPEKPDWDFIGEAAATLTDRENGVSGICLRGKPGWGENVAFITAMANSYGARWFDLEWRPQLDSEAWHEALGDYAELLAKHGPTDPAERGFRENLALFRQGQCAIWIDATSAGQFVTDESSSVAGKVGFAMAPGKGLGKRANWLWSWALAIPRSSEAVDAAKAFVAWATSREYVELVAESDGWASVPPGTRASLYDHPEYRQVPFAAMTLASIEAANPERPTVERVPYSGIQFVPIPEFQGIGTAVGGQFSQILEKEISVDEALANAQWVTERQNARARILEKD